MITTTRTRSTDGIDGKDAVGLYLDAIAKTPLLSAEEEVQLARAIEACRKAGKYVGICGQGPSDHPDFAEWLVDQGITSISLNPDTVVSTWQRLGARAGK